MTSARTGRRSVRCRPPLVRGAALIHAGSRRRPLPARNALFGAGVVVENTAAIYDVTVLRTVIVEA